MRYLTGDACPTARPVGVPVGHDGGNSPARLAVTRAAGDGDTTGVFRAYRMTGAAIRDSVRIVAQRCLVPALESRPERRTGCSVQEIQEIAMKTTTRLSRRQFGRLGAAALAGGALAGMSVSGALQAPITSTKEGDVPSYGGMRPGPIGLAPSPITRNRGIRPVALRYDKFAIDAPIEYLQIVDGVMMNPTGPWVVGWYEPTAALGQFGNSVYAGHVDYWDVGPAIFYSITHGDV